MAALNGIGVSNTPRDSNFSTSKAPSDYDKACLLSGLFTGIMLDSDLVSDSLREEARRSEARQVLRSIESHQGIHVHVCPPPPRLGVSEQDLCAEVSQALAKCGIQETSDLATDEWGPVLVLRLEARRHGRIVAYRISVDVRQGGIVSMAGAQKILASCSLWKTDLFNVSGFQQPDSIRRDVRATLRRLTRDLHTANKATPSTYPTIEGDPSHG